VLRIVLIAGVDTTGAPSGRHWAPGQPSRGPPAVGRRPGRWPLAIEERLLPTRRDMARWSPAIRIRGVPDEGGRQGAMNFRPPIVTRGVRGRRRSSSTGSSPACRLRLGHPPLRRVQPGPDELRVALEEWAEAYPRLRWPRGPTSPGPGTGPRPRSFPWCSHEDPGGSRTMQGHAVATVAPNCSIRRLRLSTVVVTHRPAISKDKARRPSPTVPSSPSKRSKADLQSDCRVHLVGDSSQRSRSGGDRRLDIEIVPLSIRFAVRSSPTVGTSASTSSYRRMATSEALRNGVPVAGLRAGVPRCRGRRRRRRGLRHALRRVVEHPAVRAVGHGPRREDPRARCRQPVRVEWARTLVLEAAKVAHRAPASIRAGPDRRAHPPDPGVRRAQHPQNLKKGGRIGGARAMVGSMLSIKRWST